MKKGIRNVGEGGIDMKTSSIAFLIVMALLGMICILLEIKKHFRSKKWKPIEESLQGLEMQVFGVCENHSQFNDLDIAVAETVLRIERIKSYLQNCNYQKGR